MKREALSLYSHKNKKTVITAAVIAGIVLGGGGLFLFHSLHSQSAGSPPLAAIPTGQTVKANSSAATSTQGQGVITTSTPTSTGTQAFVGLPNKTGLSVHNSASYRLGFYYGSTGDFATKEQGNKITIYDTKNPAVTQWVEVFSKTPSDTIQQAITKEVLGGYNSADCIIGTAITDGYKYPSNIQTASITYNPNNIDQYGDVINTAKCPISYAIHGEERLYFLIDINHPDRLLFFHLNGLGIGAGNNEWQDTITLF